MSKPDNFITTTDFPTLKNTHQGLTATITVPGSVSIPGNGYIEYHEDLSVGSVKGAVTRSRIRSSKYGSRWIATKLLQFDLRTGTNDGGPAPYTVMAFVWMPSAGIIRCSVLVTNPYSTTTIGAAGNETVDFNVAAFLPPFA